MGSKPSKRSSTVDQTLSEETIAELCEDTGFTEDELRTWHSNFLRDCPDGKLTLKQFEHEYARIMGKPTQKTSDYVKHMFNVYDQDKNQFIDFREFVMALSAASVVNRLRLIETLFHVFDLDDDGKITKDEIGKMLHTLVDVTAKSGKQHHHHQQQEQQQQQINLQQRIDDAFNELNSNDDDHITKDEFIEWYMKSGLLSEAKADEITVADTSRIQEISKKTRKTKKQQQLQQKKSSPDGPHSNGDGTRHVSSHRHTWHMTEHKSPRIEEEDENDQMERERRMSENYLEENDIGPVGRPSPIEIYTSSPTTDDSDSHYSKENERWQHLFNSVLGQIREQRHSHEQNRTTTTTSNGHTSASNFHGWKRDAEEKLKFEYLRQKSTNSNGNDHHHHLSTERGRKLSSSTSDDRSPSPDIVTIRL